MKTKNIFKVLALAMLLPAMLLTTACSNSDGDAVVNNNEQTAKKGYPLQVTVNVTREGDEATTRATFNGTKIEFSAGDKLFVWCQSEYSSAAGIFAGTLDYVPESGGTFSGTIYTHNLYSGTADALFTAAGGYTRAALLPAGYGTYGFFSIDKKNGYDDELDYADAAFATSTTEKTAKALAVEQFSYEFASGYSGGFSLSPLYTILNFTISGLTPSTEVTATLMRFSNYDPYDLVTGSVTTDGSGNATFAMAIDGDRYDITQFILAIGGYDIELSSTSKELVAGHIYNITRSTGSAYKKAADATAGDVGKWICSKGHIHAADFDGACWGTLDALITYVGNDAETNTTYNHGLALARYDANSGDGVQ